MCAGATTPCVKVRGQLELTGIGSYFLPCESRGLNLGCQAYWQVVGKLTQGVNSTWSRAFNPPASTSWLLGWQVCTPTLLRTPPRALYTLGQHFTYWATLPAPICMPSLKKYLYRLFARYKNGLLILLQQLLGVCILIFLDTSPYQGKGAGMLGQAVRLSELVLEPLDVDSEVFSGNMDNYPTNLLFLASCSSVSDTSGLKLPGPTVFHSPWPVEAVMGELPSFRRPQKGCHLLPACSATTATPLLGQLPPKTTSQGKGLPRSDQQERPGRKPARAAAAPPHPLSPKPLMARPSLPLLS